MSKTTNTPTHILGIWVGHIANYPTKIKFELTNLTDTLVGMIWQPPTTEETEGTWSLMRTVELNDSKLTFRTPDGGMCECYVGEHSLAGAYYPSGMITKNAPLGFQFGRTVRNGGGGNTGTQGVATGCAAAKPCI